MYRLLDSNRRLRALIHHVQLHVVTVYFLFCSKTTRCFNPIRSSFTKPEGVSLHQAHYATQRMQNAWARHVQQSIQRELTTFGPLQKDKLKY